MKFVTAVGLKKLRVQSSLFAPSFYEALGFKKVRRIKRSREGRVYYNILFVKVMD